MDDPNTGGLEELELEGLVVSACRTRQELEPILRATWNRVTFPGAIHTEERFQQLLDFVCDELGL
jgi:hypothetical protein